MVAPTEDKQYDRFSGESQFYDRQTLRGSGEIHKRGGNHTVSLFFSIFYDISNELRSTDFP